MMKEFFQNIKPKLLWFFQSFIWLGLLLLIIDIVTKNVVVANRDAILASSNQGIILIPGFLAINYVINTGAAFGLSAGNSDAAYLANRIIYIVIASLATIGLIIFFVRSYLKGKPLTKYYRACVMLILAGAIGNLIDRIAYTPEYLGNKYNGVVDWINFFGIWGYNFNIADSCLVIGVIMVIVMLIVEEVKDSRKRNAIIRKNIAEQKAKEEAEKAKAEEKKEPETEAQPQEEPSK